MAIVYNLSDEQWLVLDLLLRVQSRGVNRLNRMEVLYSANLPQGAALKLTWAALTMPDDLVHWIGQHDFEITEAGVSLYNLRFGTAQKAPSPSTIADTVICLPGPSHYAN